MKIYELQKYDTFKAELHDVKVEDVSLTITGEFLEMYGMYAKVQLYGIEDVQYLKSSLEVERTN
ncbi:MAG: hypothetical protein JHC33_14610 [Ignisphaera sp.]|nr:hypothetical protein [Ignisphaera sp.]